jgi:hypothetical protein
MALPPHRETEDDAPPSIALIPADASALLVLAHGAGAGMRHPFMQTIAERLAGRRIATFRYEFPYVSQGRRRPDTPAVLMATVRAAVAAATQAAHRAGGLPIIAGGKSMGGRLTSLAAAPHGLPGVRGVLFLGFPLHPPGEPSAARAAHLATLDLPMLFLQGTRDRLAELTLLRPVCRDLGSRATLRVIEGADHSFHVTKRSARTDTAVLDEIADTVAQWVGRIT